MSNYSNGLRGRRGNSKYIVGWVWRCSVALEGRISFRETVEHQSHVPDMVSKF